MEQGQRHPVGRAAPRRPGRRGARRRCTPWPAAATAVGDGGEVEPDAARVPGAPGSPSTSPKCHTSWSNSTACPPGTIRSPAAAHTSAPVNGKLPATGIVRLAPCLPGYSYGVLCPWPQRQPAVVVVVDGGSRRGRRRSGVVLGAPRRCAPSRKRRVAMNSTARRLQPSWREKKPFSRSRSGACRGVKIASGQSRHNPRPGRARLAGRAVCSVDSGSVQAATNTSWSPETISPAVAAFRPSSRRAAGGRGGQRGELLAGGDRRRPGGAGPCRSGPAR